MPTEIRMPELSSDMTEADLVQWLVAVGDTIAAGELIAEIVNKAVPRQSLPESAGAVHA